MNARLLFLWRRSVCAEDGIAAKNGIRIVNKRIYLDEDTRLMLKAAEDDGKAYDKLYRKYFSAVTSFISSLDERLQSPGDIAQEVFTRVWEKRATYRPNAAFKTYLFGYAINVFHEHKHSQWQESSLCRIDSLNLVPNSSQTGLAAKIDDSISLLKELIAKLPSKQKQVSELVYLRGFLPKETAKKLGCPLRSVHQSLYLARKNLRKFAASSPPYFQGYKRLTSTQTKK